MAHLAHSMAYVKETPWHWHGNQLSENQPLEIWLREAGMEWQIKESEVLYSVSEGKPVSSVSFRHVLRYVDAIVPIVCIVNAALPDPLFI